MKRNFNTAKKPFTYTFKPIYWILVNSWSPHWTTCSLRTELSSPLYTSSLAQTSRDQLLKYRLATLLSLPQKHLLIYNCRNTRQPECPLTQGDTRAFTHAIPSIFLSFTSWILCCLQRIHEKNTAYFMTFYHPSRFSSPSQPL